MATRSDRIQRSPSGTHPARMRCGGDTQSRGAVFQCCLGTHGSYLQFAADSRADQARANTTRMISAGAANRSGNQLPAPLLTTQAVGKPFNPACV